MALGTFSIFYFGHEVTASNNMIPIDEGDGEINAELNIGFYSLTDFTTEVARALNDIGDNAYSVSVDRDTRIITITSDDDFDLLFLTGGSASISARDLLGFEHLDFTGDDEYTGSLASGYEYRPQFFLQDYLSKDDNMALRDAVVNRSSTGRVQVVNFGVERFFKMNIKFITNLPMDNVVIKNNPSGVSDARAFMENIVQKANFEFMPDIAERDEYFNVILESSPKEKDGTGYELKELTGSNVPNVYETGVLTLRLIED